MSSSINKTFNKLFKEVYSDKLNNYTFQYDSPFYNLVYGKFIILKLLWKIRRNREIKKWE